MGGLKGALPTIRLGVIKDARRRQRRRRVALLVGVAAALAVVVLVAERPVDEPPAPPAAAPPAPPTKLLPWTRVLTRVPYMGVACSTPSSTACHRIGLAVWLKRPAVAVDATLVGRRLPLDSKDWWGRSGPRGRRMFVGYLRGPDVNAKLGIPPVSHWEGAPTPLRVVRLRISYRDGAREKTRVRVPLMAGWG